MHSASLFTLSHTFTHTHTFAQVPGDAAPLRLRAGWALKSISQSTPYPDAINTLTISLASFVNLTQGCHGRRSREGVQEGVQGLNVGWTCAVRAFHAHILSHTHTHSRTLTGTGVTITGLLGAATNSTTLAVRHRIPTPPYIG